MDTNITNENPHACSFTELSIRYNPHLSVKSCRRILFEWIEYNMPLSAELGATGWNRKNRMLTPMQVSIIYRFLGEP